MSIKRWTPSSTRAVLILAIGAIVLQSGCNMQFRRLRFEGKRALIHGNHAAARGFFQDANELRPGHAETLLDLAAGCEYFASRQLEFGNRIAARRELDRALEYYERALGAHPGLHAALVGMNHVLELQGRAGEALARAQWASEVVGPAAIQQIFLAAELEERGDLDGAMAHYRLAVTMEPDNPRALVEMGRFLVRRGQTQETLIHLKKAYAIDPAQIRASEVLLTLEGASATSDQHP